MCYHPIDFRLTCQILVAVWLWPHAVFQIRTQGSNSGKSRRLSRTADSPTCIFTCRSSYRKDSCPSKSSCANLVRNLQLDFCWAALCKALESLSDLPRVKQLLSRWQPLAVPITYSRLSGALPACEAVSTGGRSLQRRKYFSRQASITPRPIKLGYACARQSRKVAQRVPSWEWGSLSKAAVLLDLCFQALHGERPHQLRTSKSNARWYRHV